MTLPNYTEKQGQYLAFIDYYTRLNHRPPAETDFQEYFKVSPPTVHQMILTLESHNYISREPGKARTIKILLPADQLPDLALTDSILTNASSFNKAYPRIAEWVSSRGWLEIGQDEYSTSMVRVLDEGGLIWEGKTSYSSLDALFQDTEVHIAKWLEGNG